MHAGRLQIIGDATVATAPQLLLPAGLC